MVRPSLMTSAVFAFSAVLADALLIARQIPGLDPSIISQGCTSQCQSLNSVLQGNSNCFSELSCVCSAQFAGGLGSCAQCAYNLSPTSFNQPPDVLMQQYTDTCAAGGFTISLPTASSAVAGSVTPTSAPISATSSVSVASSSSRTSPLSTSKPSQSVTNTSTSGGSTPSPSSTSGATSTSWNVISLLVAVVVGVLAS